MTISRGHWRKWASDVIWRRCPGRLSASQLSRCYHWPWVSVWRHRNLICAVSTISQTLLPYDLLHDWLTHFHRRLSSSSGKQTPSSGWILLSLLSVNFTAVRPQSPMSLAPPILYCLTHYVTFKPAIRLFPHLLRKRKKPAPWVGFRQLKTDGTVVGDSPTLPPRSQQQCNIIPRIKRSMIQDDVNRNQSCHFLPKSKLIPEELKKIPHRQAQSSLSLKVLGMAKINPKIW